MPTINKPKRQPREQNRSSASFLVWKEIYNTSHWRKLRQAKLMDQPLCEMCLAEGRVTAAEEVHHIVEIQTKEDILEQKTLAYDYNNLMSVCKKCHMKHHGNKHKKI